MFKEKVKTSIIVVLIINLVMLTYQSWFKSGLLGPDWPYFSFSDLPLVRLFARDSFVSVPKENLSKPRKIVVNDGELWVPYYNTDDAFGNLDDNTGAIIKSLLSGNIEKTERIDYNSWLSLLARPGVYVEYPVRFEPRMLAMVLNTDFERLPSEIELISDAIIIPAFEDSVYVALRDADTNTSYKFLIKDGDISFPEEVLLMYTNKYRRDGYYEFAFNTLLSEGLGEGNVKVSDMVLFSDNEAVNRDIIGSNPIKGKNHGEILKSFSFNPKPLRYYTDGYGASNYVENYATVTIFPDGYIEYSAVESDKGINLGEYGANDYEILNRAIDFAEKVWSSVSNEPLSVLVSGIEKTEAGNRFVLDYYYGGREIAVEVAKEGREGLYHAIEIETSGSNIISYRQFLRSYTAASSTTRQEHFMLALDYFVGQFAYSENTVITDLYPGYFDYGQNTGVLKTTWLCEINNSEQRYPKK
ncbi:MAG: hypothetical protein IKU60_01505 [Clostridia bacterium]|nr:hypothetical protein [Clostridia bacterium]